MSNLDVLEFNKRQLKNLWSDVKLTMVSTCHDAHELWHFRPSRSFDDLLIKGDQLTRFWIILNEIGDDDDVIKSSNFVIAASEVDIVDILIDNADHICQRSLNIKDRFVTSTFRYLRTFIDFDPIELIKERREEAKLPRIPDLSQVYITQTDLDFLFNHSIKHNTTSLEELTRLDNNDPFA